MCVGGGTPFTKVGAEMVVGGEKDKIKPPEAEPTPRGERRPDEAARRSALRAMLASGAGQRQATLLTGPSGVDPAQLNLGKTMLTGA